MSEYAEVGSFELSGVDASASGEDEVVLLADGEVVHVKGRERTTLQVEGEPVDVAVAELVYVLTSESLVALSVDGRGSRGWSVDLSGESVAAVAAIPDSDVVCVLTPTSLIGVDRERGSRRWSTDRPYADIEDEDDLAAGDEHVLYGTWTFVTGFDASGEQALDGTLDSAVVDVGWTDGVVVAALKTGKLVGLDVEDGRVRWETEISARAVASGGTTEAFVQTDDGVLRVSGDGSYEPVDDLTPGTVYPARSGALACVFRDEMLSVYRRRIDPDAVEAVLETSTVEPGTDVEVRVRSALERAATVRVDASVEDGTVDGSGTAVDVPAGGESLVAFRVEDVDRVDETTVHVAVNDVEVVEESVAVDRPTPDADAISCSVDLGRVDGASVDGTVVVENDGETSPRLRVVEDDADLGIVAPGETATASVSAPFVPGEPVERTIASETGERVATGSATLGDGRTTVALEQTVDDEFLFVDVTVSNGTDATATDELVVFGLGALDPVERDVTCVAGSTWTLSLAVPGRVATSLDGNTVRAQLDGSAANDSLELALDDAFADADAGVDAGSEPAASTGVSATVERSLSAETVAATERFQEYVAIEPDRDVHDLTLLVDGEEHAVGSASAGIERRLERKHAVAVDGRHRLGDGRVVADGDDAGEFDGATASVVDGEIAARTTVECGDSRIHVEGEIENRTGDYLDVVGVRVDRLGTWDLRLGDALAPGEVVVWAGDVAPTETDVTAAEAAVGVTVEFGDPEAPVEFQSLASVERASTDELLDRLEVTVGEGTRVRDEYSNVALELTNVGDSVEYDLELAAVGDVVNDVVYVPERIDELAPGETAVHPIDVKPAGESLSLDVEVESGEQSARIELEGPVAPRDGEWDASHHDAWGARWLGGRSDDEIAYPQHVATEYERTR
ncbi:PQQ-binding-like beta-propeller repeat protein [Halorubellus sp. PRR65]|uniref:outer membrane protein assembly factor BamB family protein n=1 Tax=Halorubellus sp. PRR65 TaxID=3098148 RepID=UPI002B25F81C|nr:PQQ-binding-like beta-propeller repeat protein [Halorubellus sp. PRR65]